MSTDETTAGGAGWPKFDTAERKVEPDIDPYEVDWQLSELPIEMRLEFQRRIANGFAVISIARVRSFEPDPPRNQGGNDGARVLFFLGLTLVSDLLGYSINSAFYFVSLVPLILLLAHTVEMSLERRAAQERISQARAQIFELRRQWLTSGFLHEDFDAAINEMYKYSDFDDKGHELFRRWWGRLQLEQVCAIRSMANLPRLAQLPVAWEISD